MKIRNGFVSNSSSSSFVINLYDISARQLQQIENYAQSEMYKKQYGNYHYDCWIIYTDKELGTIRGTTSMDNFDMEEYLESIGIIMNRVKWGD